MEFIGCLFAPVVNPHAPVGTFQFVRNPDELVGRFRENGLRITPQRRAVFSVLHGNDTHPSADAVYRAASALVPGMSLRTVYQILDELTTLGEIQVVHLDPGAARFDPNVDDHHHVVCEHCGAVRDVNVDLSGLPSTGPALRGFRVDRTEVIFRGSCESCSDTPRRPAPVGRSVQSIP